MTDRRRLKNRNHSNDSGEKSLNLHIPRNHSESHLCGSRHRPSGSILSSATCLAPDGNTRSRSNGPVPSATQAQHSLDHMVPACVLMGIFISGLLLPRVSRPSDRAVRPGRRFPGSSPTMTSCWNPGGSGSRTGCHRGTLGRQQSDGVVNVGTHDTYTSLHNTQ